MKEELYIIGQGLAGTMLSIRLWQDQIPFKVIDEPSLSQSSRIAAGLANPVVLKRQKWVADAELYMEEAPRFYPEMEELLQTKFYHPVRLEHIFHKAGEVNDWQSNGEKPHLKNHLGPIFNDALPSITAPHGRGQVKGIFWLDTVAFIESWKSFLRKHDLLIEQKWTADTLGENSTKIFCNGQLLRASHPHLADAFSPTKGEVMLIEASSLPEDRILHAGVFCLPLGNKIFKVGATYSHRELNQETTANGLDFLKTKLEAFYTGEYRVIEQLAGLRPNIKDRKPLMGRISASDWTFNGFGSRGVLMGPYLSQHFCNHLLNGEALSPQWDLNRFTSS